MKAKKYYQTPASRVIKVKVQQLLGDSPDNPSTEPGESREQRNDWGED
jgi:hypothetical protein